MEPGSDHHCHCEEQSDVAISWYYLYYCIRGSYQEIATGLKALAMTR